MTPATARILLHLRLDKLRSEPRPRYLDPVRGPGEEQAADVAARTRAEHTLRVIALTDRELTTMLASGWNPRHDG